MIRVALRVRRQDAELVLAELLELAPGGVEECDEGDVVEYAVYGAPGELPALPALRAVAGGAFVDVTTSDVADDWDERWKSFHRPVEVGPAGRRLRVRAPWHDRGEHDLVIDPGQAFGTGAHPTTRLSLELLAAIESPDPAARVVDVGCGSGVLAIAAARLGWGTEGGVLALDHDVLAVEATRANARANGAALDAARFDVRDEPVPAGDLVLANLLRPLLLAARFAGPPRTLVASGLLRREGDEVTAHLEASLGLRQVARLESEGWIAMALVSAAR